MICRTFLACLKSSTKADSSTFLGWRTKNCTKFWSKCSSICLWPKAKMESIGKRRSRGWAWKERWDNLWLRLFKNTWMMGLRIRGKRRRMVNRRTMSRGLRSWKAIKSRRMSLLMFGTKTKTRYLLFLSPNMSWTPVLMHPLALWYQQNRDKK